MHNKNMIFCLWICLLMAACGQKKTESGENTTARPSADSTAQNTDLFGRLTGIWMDKQYLDRLKSSRSPISAITAVPTLSFYTQENQNTIFFNYAFHEGDQAVIGKIETTANGSFRLDNYEVTLSPDGNSLTIQSPKEQAIPEKVTFERISSSAGEATASETEIARYVHNLVLAGKYKDENGKEYRFTPDMKAEFPGESFSYQLSLDNTMTSCDYIFQQNSENVVAFKWQGDKLLLIRPDKKDEMITCTKKPFAVLSKQ